ncbi:MAG TPA: hemerythrin domain-containing protein [Terriglobia bacterium]|nr:hemerythrin domain-containing protein [Terriglobia bacterium]
MPSGSRSSKPAGRADAISLLTQDHRKVKRLLNSLDRTTDRATNRRETLLKQIETEIKMHSQLEEEIFYPVYRDAVRKSDGHLYYESLEEHHLVDIVLSELNSAKVNSEEFGAKGKVLKDLIDHHAEEEETEMFPKARKVMGADQLRELGNQLRERKQTLQSGLLTRAARTAGAAFDSVLSKVGRKSAA